MRALILLLMLSSMSLNARAKASDSWEFDVYLDDKKVGFHDFSITQSGNLL